MGKVTTAGRFDPKVGKGTNNAIFKKGYEEGVEEIQFPTDISGLVTAAKDSTSAKRGHYYNDSIWVKLVPRTDEKENDARAIVRRASAAPETLWLNNGTFNGALVSGKAVSVAGTLDGQLTIGSLTNVWVRDDIEYREDPREIPTSTDILGLVSKKDVKIQDNVLVNGDRTIQASLFTIESFTAENWTGRPLNGALHVLGSIVQNERGAVGTFSGGTRKSGFSKRYRYDDRLSDPNFRPPFFPGFTARTFAIANWWESYRVLEFRD
jgi:hypothetical protein